MGIVHPSKTAKCLPQDDRGSAISKRAIMQTSLQSRKPGQWGNQWQTCRISHRRDCCHITEYYLPLLPKYLCTMGHCMTMRLSSSRMPYFSGDALTWYIQHGTPLTLHQQWAHWGTAISNASPTNHISRHLFPFLTNRRWAYREGICCIALWNAVPGKHYSWLAILVSNPLLYPNSPPWNFHKAGGTFSIQIDGTLSNLILPSPDVPGGTRT